MPLELGLFSAFSGKIIPVGPKDSSLFLDKFRLAYSSLNTGNTFCLLENSSPSFPIINTAACIYRKLDFNKLKGFDESLRVHEDTDLSVRAHLSGCHLCVSSDSIAYVFWDKGIWGYLLRALKHGKEGFHFKSLWRFKSSLLWLKRSFQLFIEFKINGLGCIAFYVLIKAIHGLGDVLERLSSKGVGSTYHRSWTSSAKNYIVPCISIDNKDFTLLPEARLILKDQGLVLVNLRNNESYMISRELIKLSFRRIEIKNLSQAGLATLHTYIS
jgi:hypothetical protein